MPPQNVKDSYVRLSDYNGLYFLSCLKKYAFAYTLPRIPHGMCSASISSEKLMIENELLILYNPATNTSGTLPITVAALANYFFVERIIFINTKSVSVLYTTIYSPSSNDVKFNVNGCPSGMFFASCFFLKYSKISDFFLFFA